MKTIIIGSRKTNGKNDPVVIARAATAAGADVQVEYWEDLVFRIKTGEVRVRGASGDLFDVPPSRILLFGWYKNGKDSIYRDVAFAFACIAKRYGCEVWNSEVLSQRSSSKLSCMVLLALEHIPVPETQFSLASTDHLQRAQVPFVAKAASTSRGRDNFLVTNEFERQEVLSAASSIRFLMQDYKENDHDLRVICFGGVPRLVLRRARASQDTHLNNTSQGGTAEWLSLEGMSAELLTICEKICKITKREMAGIDLIPDKLSAFGYSCLEVNAIPQLTSGVAVDTKMSAFADVIANGVRR